VSRRKKSGVTRTTVVVVQDKSGSMGNRTAATISGYNEYLGRLKEKAEGDVRVTLTQFDTHVNNVYTAQPLSAITELQPHEYRIGGMTALYDAVGQAVKATEKAIAKDEKVLIVIMTDGGENSSREWICITPNENRNKRIVDLMQEKRAEGWEFIFLGAGEEAWNTGANLGFQSNQFVNYGTDSAATMDAYSIVADASVGLTRGVSTQSYLSNSSLKADLEDKSGFTMRSKSKDHHEDLVSTNSDKS
jgi:uncharacterized protein YegL